MNSRLPSIADFARSKAKTTTFRLLASLFVVSYLIVMAIASSFQLDRIDSTLDLLEASLEQPLGLGGDYVTKRIAAGFENSGHNGSVWIYDMQDRLLASSGSISVVVHPSDLQLKQRSWFFGNWNLTALFVRPIAFNGFHVGAVVYEYRLPVVWIIVFTGLLALVFFGVALYYVHSIRRLAMSLAEPLLKLSEKIRVDSQLESVERVSDELSFSEIKLVFDEVLTAQRKASEAEAVARQTLVKAQTLKIGSGVKHDVLAATQVADGICRTLPSDLGERRDVLRSVIDRIESTVKKIPRYSETSLKDIEGLIDCYKLSDSKSKIDESRSWHLATLAKQSVEEAKELEERRRKEVSIELDVAARDFDCFADIEPILFQRALLNLLTNALHASRKGEEIRVVVRKTSRDSVQVEVRDNGCGISPQELKLIGRSGYVSSKPEGSGEGLVICNEAMKRWGGELAIQSKVGEGTIVSMKFPAGEPNRISPLDLSVMEDSTVIVVDDDPAVHYSWKKRFEAAAEKATTSVRMESVFSIDEFENAIGQLDLTDSYVVLMDNDLGESGPTGLDYISTSDYKSHCVLVTSCGSDESVYQRCLHENIPLLPKSMQPFIPVNILSYQ